jgi:hypothetical protein
MEERVRSKSELRQYLAGALPAHGPDSEVVATALGGMSWENLPKPVSGRQGDGLLRGRVHAIWPQWPICCAQQTGMDICCGSTAHCFVIYLPEGKDVYMYI